MNRSRCGIALSLLVACGCSSLPGPSDPARDPAIQALAAAARPAHGRLALAPLRVELADSERAKGWHLEELPELSPAAFARDATVALRASARWSATEEVADAQVAAAWTHGDDFLARLTVQHLRTRFEGHNGWWLPNVVNFALNLFPAWFVATEEYTLALDAELELWSAASGAHLATRAWTVSVAGTFDELDRGLQLLGPIWPSFDADLWRNVAGKLAPGLRQALAVTLAAEADAALVELGDGLPALTRQVLAVVAGVSHYADLPGAPVAPGCANDAELISAGLVESRWLRQQQVRTLRGAEASEARLLASIDEHLGRARPHDLSVIYLAGYGAYDAGGQPCVLLADARADQAQGWLALPALLDRLERLPGSKLLIVDAGFAGVGRSYPGAHDGGFAVADLTRPRVATWLAAGPHEAALTPNHLDGGGLFTHHLALRLLSGLGDELTTAHAGVRDEVAAYAELVGVSQRPVLAHPGPTFALRARPAGEAP